MSETVSISAEKQLVSNSPIIGGYDPSFFDTLARIEDRHFWFRARNHLILNLTAKLSSTLPRAIRILEVGCGNGNVLRMLRKACPQGRVVGLDLWFDGLRHAKSRSGCLLVQGDVRSCPFRKPFDVVCIFDVLEHVQQEKETLAALWELLAPGGSLLLTVPAHQSLWSYFDEAARHCRRYSVQDLGRKLADAGFEVEFLSQFMASIFPIVWIFRKMRGQPEQLNSEKVRSYANAEFRIVPIVNQVLTALLTLEARWIARGHRLPIGTSLVAVARRPA